MIRRYEVVLGMVVVAFVAGASVDEVPAVETQSSQVYELRIYTTAENRLGALLQRFGGGELDLFHKHGMQSVGYWVPDDAPTSANTMIYMLAHESREAAAESWQGFLDDPAWKTMYAESIADGPIVTDIESTFMNPTDFSPVQ